MLAVTSLRSGRRVSLFILIFVALALRSALLLGWNQAVPTPCPMTNY